MHKTIQRLDFDLYLSIFWLIMGILFFVIGGFSLTNTIIASVCFIASLGYSVTYHWSVGKFIKERKILLDEDGQYTLFSSQHKQQAGERK